MAFGCARSARSAHDTSRSMPPAACSVAVAATTVTVIANTSLGGDVGGRPKTKTRTTSPIAATVPSPAPPTRAPIKMLAKTTASSSQSMVASQESTLAIARRRAAARHRARVQYALDLGLAEQPMRPNQLDDA